jgi:hypothetical protein
VRAFGIPPDTTEPSTPIMVRLCGELGDYAFGQSQESGVAGPRNQN